MQSFAVTQRLFGRRVCVVGAILSVLEEQVVSVSTRVERVVFFGFLRHVSCLCRCQRHVEDLPACSALIGVGKVSAF